MSRLGADDSKRIADISDSLGRWTLGEQSALATLVPQLFELLDAKRATAYGIDYDEQALMFSFLHGTGFSQPVPSVLGIINAYLQSARTVRNPLVAYNPLKVESNQRNRAIGFRGRANRLRMLQKSPFAQNVFPRLGLDDCDQVRVLICDGPHLLAWVGAFRPETFTRREEQLLSRLIPPLHQRLKVEHQLGSAALSAAAIPAAMEAISSAAFIVSGSGHIAHANTAGAQLIQEAPEAVDWLRTSMADSPSCRFSRTTLLSAGTPNYHLAVLKRPVRDPSAQLALAMQRWGLTDKQFEVLQWLVRGAANKTIATALECAEGTVELHVTALMAKADVSSRAALVASFWSMA